MKNTRVWIGIVILILSSAIFGISFSYEYYSRYTPGAGLFPRWISGFMIVLSILYIFELIKKGNVSYESILPKGRQLQYILKIIISFILLILLAPYAGYTIAGIVMLYIVLSHDYKWYWALGISTSTTVVLVFVFYKLLKIQLPVNSLGW